MYWILHVIYFGGIAAIAKESFYNETDLPMPLKRYARITEGIQVPVTLHPYVALILIHLGGIDGGDTFCGGSVISSRFILTAAHCLKKKNTSQLAAKHLTVFLGSSKPKRGIKYKVCRVLVHEQFGTQKYFFDIAILLLRTDIKFRPSIQKIDIAPHSRWRNPRYLFTIAGFGRTDWLRTPNPVLKAARMRYVSSEECAHTPTETGKAMPVPDSMFCLTSRHWAAACYGDSGSGVVWKKYLVGVVSINRIRHCGVDAIPSMYTDVVYFKPWVDEQVARLEASHQCE